MDDGNRFRTTVFGFGASLMLLLSLGIGVFGFPGSAAWTFIFLYGATGVAGLTLILLLPAHWSAQRRILIILALSIVTRLALLPHPPSDDLNRYIWEGRVLAAGFNPYELSPTAEALTELRDDTIFPGINHADQSACYPPLMILLFSVLTLLTPPSIPIMLAFKIVLLLPDLLTVLALIALLRASGRDERWALLYSLNPVVLMAFAGQAHLDSFHTGFLALALLLHYRRAWPWAFLALAFAAQSKYVAGLALPFLFTRENLRWAWVFPLAFIIPFIPFLNQNTEALFTSLFHFGSAMAFGGAVHPLLRWGFGSIEPATQICALLFGLTVLATLVRFLPSTWRGESAVNPLLIVFGALLIFSPTIHFWYLAWIIPLVALRPSLSWVTLSLTMGLYFLAPGYLHQGLGWHLPPTASLGIWIPFLLILLFEAKRGWLRAKHHSGWAPPQTFSVIIPTSNESGRIETCIGAVLAADPKTEVILADGGSTDDTIQKAKAMGATIVRHPFPYDQGGGRGGQISAGLAEASGDVVLIVHADTLVQSDLFGSIRRRLTFNPTISGGAVGSRFNDSGLFLRLLELANDLRAVLLGISFGDQVQFFRRLPVVENHVYPAIPLMEDVELSLRLQTLGETAFLWGRCSVSPRRWTRDGYSRSLTVITLVTKYLLTRLVTIPDTIAMYRRYYQTP